MRLTNKPRLQLKHLFYVTAMLAAALRLMDWIGLFAGVSICCGWYYVFFGRKRTPRERFNRILLILFSGFLGSLIIPVNSRVRIDGYVALAAFWILAVLPGFWYERTAKKQSKHVLTENLPDGPTP